MVQNSKIDNNTIKNKEDLLFYKFIIGYYF